MVFHGTAVQTTKFVNDFTNVKHNSFLKTRCETSLIAMVLYICCFPPKQPCAETVLGVSSRWMFGLPCPLLAPLWPLLAVGSRDLFKHTNVLKQKVFLWVQAQPFKNTTLFSNVTHTQCFKKQCVQWFQSQMLNNIRLFKGFTNMFKNTNVSMSSHTNI